MKHQTEEKPNTPRRRLGPHVPFVFSLLFLAACQPEKGHLPGADFGAPVTTRDPAMLLSLAISTTTPEDSRKKADQLLAEVSGPRDETRLAMLDQILYAPAHSDAMRIYAMDQLAAADPARAARTLALYLPRFEEDVLDHACTLATRLGDPRLVSPLIRSLERAPQFENFYLQTRPEWKAIETLAGKSVEGALWAALSQSGSTDPRVAALAILQRLQSQSALLSRLQALPTSDPWLSTIIWWGGSFGSLPSGANESAWVQTLHRPEHAALVARALERYKLLAGQPDDAARPQFTQALAYAADDAVRMSRDQLLADIQRRLDALPHAHRESSTTGGPDDTPETLTAAAPKLNRADLLTIHLLLHALQDAATLAEFQRLGLADMSDTTTEHGGLLSFQNIANPSLSITPIAPTYANSDFEYVTSDKAVQQAATGIALYHFHFQQIKNTDRAGPGVGDLKFAAASHCNCVVITSTNTREVDVDYYTPAGAVVDLGIYKIIE